MTGRARHAFAVMSCVIISAVLSASSVEAARDVRAVKGIEFNGLKYLSRYEILRHAVYRVDGDSLVIDVGSLRDGLDRMPMVRRYTLEEKDGRLAVVVEENEPAHLVLFDGDGRLVPVEFDAGMKVLATGTIHAAERPIIVAASRDLVEGGPSARLRGALSVLSELEGKGLPVIREIEEVDMTAHPGLRVKLKGRPTVFTLDMDRASFRALNMLVGYLDAARRYPARSEVRANAAVLK